MIWVSLLLSTLLWVYFGHSMSPKRSAPAGVTFIVVTLLALPVTMCMGLWLPLVLGQGVVLALTCFLPITIRRPYRTGAMLTGLAYIFVGAFIFRNVVDLREKFPLESLEARLPRHQKYNVSTTEEDGGFLDIVQSKSILDQWKSEEYYGHRDFDLAELHSHSVRAFARAIGFGRFRPFRIGGMDERTLTGDRDHPELPQPADRPLFSLSASNPSPSAKFLAEAFVEKATHSEIDRHREWWLVFLKSNRFGYFRNRKEVAGFQPHRIAKPYGMNFGVDLDSMMHSLASLELVGLLLNDEPVVYVSDVLPSMAKLNATPKRPLDAFETDALREIEKGRTLVKWKQEDHPRAMGAIRATNACTECHDCPRGALLGTFLYTFTKS